MKILIVAFALVACVASEWAPKTADEMKAINTECLATLPAEYVEKANAFEYPDVEPVRKYILCNGEKSGFFCEHEGWHVDRIVKQFKLNMDDAEVAAVVEKCIDKNEQKSSTDVWAFRGHKCIYYSKLGENIREVIREHKAAA